MPGVETTGHRKSEESVWAREFKETYLSALRAKGGAIKNAGYPANNYKSSQQKNEKMKNPISATDVQVGENNPPEEDNQKSLHEKKKIFFEVYKKYYFIEMTEYHKSRENCTNNFINFLERISEKMAEALKHGSYNINNLNRFFKEFIKNDTSYYNRSVSMGDSTRVNNLNQSFLNIQNEELANGESANIVHVQGENPLNSQSNGSVGDLKKKKENAASTTVNEGKTKGKKNNKMDYAEEKKKKGSKREEEIAGNAQEENAADTPFLTKNNGKNASSKINEIADNVIDVNADMCNLNQNIIDDWVQYGFMNYRKIMNSMKISCDVIDSKINQKMLNILKDSYLKEQENLIDAMKKKKNDFLKQVELCKIYWKYFENSYSNSEKIRSDGIKDSKKIKCSWLCQRKYIKNVKDLLKIQNEYLDIINSSVKIFFQLIEWKKNSIRDILCSYILLYKSFLNFYLNNMNILYDSILLEKNIDAVQFQNLSSVSMIDDQDLIKQVTPFHLIDNCDGIPQLNKALSLIKSSIIFYNQEINVKSILCIFSSRIKGYLTSVGFFNKCVEGIIVITWDKFIHFFADVEDATPQWSYYMEDIEFKLVKCKTDTKGSTLDTDKRESDGVTDSPEGEVEQSATANVTVTTQSNQQQSNNSKETKGKKGKEKSSGKDTSSALSGKDAPGAAFPNTVSSTKNENPDIDVNTSRREFLENSSTTQSSINEENDVEIQMRDKKKTLLISGWSFTFKCSTIYLTNVCYELLSNHLCSEYFEDENSFANFSNIIANGEVKNDLQFIDQMASFYNTYMEGMSDDTKDKVILKNKPVKTKNENFARERMSVSDRDDLVDSPEGRSPSKANNMDDQKKKKKNSHPENLLYAFNKKKNELLKNVKIGDQENGTTGQRHAEDVDDQTDAEAKNKDKILDSKKKKSQKVNKLREGEGTK
ncbi:conserved Plasmodium protein, unknown function [Plasmodium knowlesi strain H]|uniref:Uncharacterized protein n=3 Tax=Plasmodium knowlesi TaxID=5850 RepID=A0A5K1UZ53_PLAKH|nr:conserved Plasmodium protein, unknown function [Plasmodium knowlesi strain H]OTN64590.1 Uncharacterized protein PKNOH_S130181500 [Plasmodium knowlesi]CAA9988983.1 conserved Plasmodium protein, unknown function [Plasmodium knowlesi strain H]SBO24827.1 conserved Plasmodium protein, unknown function [Plasmodium knowlesi strain H]SBO28090.1 conserved Plasmodium protein, unknown function [Plasmodium knowlesi strain H]VVS78457.1 conserved Plasmodium protein, unknown function [Plasmodium knowlesi |eukprot:XP_002261331.1 hypothetical protein, conserved in Plasmodium species [Plasmodium knowlesi strain H]